MTKDYLEERDEDHEETCPPSSPPPPSSTLAPPPPPPIDPPRSEQKSQFKGVYKCGKKWKSRIQVDNVQYYLGE
jgi:hypothetical protein